MNCLGSVPVSNRMAGEEGSLKFWPLPSVLLLVTKQGDSHWYVANVRVTLT